ncbi:TonB-dependent receptor plug domain-containing protein [Sphingobacterium sp. SRCM116780]|uniref:TonB-dependent receptor plug domain-containing protein n=1 Tax=Sphingobacterium sp. SRCM116780 TaxID=2907623 RepID=UPI001F1E0B29|nr:TonB-dependent receptor plug domain-containing protein [Sphingobacterium sp. SRCM116780]UIR55685.1 TonB-dependent receptor plug domain-containing protein [Sphingobacterium sp. SRCM116780]
MSFKSIILSLLFIVPTITFGQTAIDNLVEKLDNYASKNIKEKVHVHTDKDSYSAGESIWMKLYCTLSPDNVLSNRSRIAYIDILSPNNKTIKSIKIPLTAGLGIGDFTIPDSATEGSYRIRAYTQWMRNDSTAYFFDKTIQVYNGRSDNTMTADQIIMVNNKTYYAIDLKTLAGNPLTETSVSYKAILKNGNEKSGREKTDPQGRVLIELKDQQQVDKVNLTFKSIDGRIVHKIFTVPPAKSSNSLQIFPESGTIINQINTKIGFKTLNNKGLGEKATIQVIDNANEEIASLETNVLGMASFPFILDAQKKYTAIATFHDGSQTKTTFPEISTSGLNMTVANLIDDKIFVQVNASPDQINNDEIFLIAQYLGNTFHVAKQKLNKEEILFSIPRKNIPAGVIQISIMNANLQPLLERIIFNYRTDKVLAINTSTDKINYGTRQKVKVSIQTDSHQDSIRVSSLSAAVVNSNKTKKDSVSKTSIFTSLLLCSEINGFIENPQYYFSDPNGLKKSELDDLMLIQGWRKLDWSTFANMPEKPKFNMETGITVSGTIKKLARKAIVPKATVTLLPTTNLLGGVDTLTNNEGKFMFDDLIFADSVKFIITAKTEKEKNRLDIDLDKIPEVSDSIGKNLPEIINNVNTEYLGSIKNTQAYFAQLEKAGLMQKSIQLEEVKITRTTQNKVSSSSSNLNGPGHADQILTAEDLSTCSTLDQCLAGRLVGVIFRDGIPYNTRGNGPMQVVLDGMYIDGDQISSLNIQDIGSIEVLRSANYATIYGSFGGNGLLIITTKTGSGLSSTYTPTGIRTFMPKGFHVNRSFFKPTYETGQTGKLTSDLRTTIHWEPNIITDQSGKSSFEFYTSDEKGPYTLIIEGADFNGRIGRKEIIINVTE